MLISFCLFVCLGVLSHWGIFHSFGDVTGEGLQILAFARHSWLLSSEGSLAYHTYCDTGYPFIMVISEDPWQHTYGRALSSGAVTTCFYDLGLSRLGFEHRTFRLRGERSSSLRHCCTTSKHYHIAGVGGVASVASCYRWLCLAQFWRSTVNLISKGLKVAKSILRYTGTSDSPPIVVRQIRTMVFCCQHYLLRT